MRKRKLIFVLMSALLISGCNTNKESSSSISGPITSETTSSSEITSEPDYEERIITAFHNLYLAPAIRFETSAPLLTIDEKVYSELNILTEEETYEMSLSAITELTNRANEDVIFKQEIDMEFDDESSHLLSYYALEILYLSFEDNDGNKFKDALSDMSLLKYLFSNAQGDEIDFAFIDAFVADGEIKAEADKLIYSHKLTNEEIATLLVQILAAGNTAQNENGFEWLKPFLWIILDNYFNFKEFTIFIVVNSENNIEEITLDFALEVTILDDLSIFDELIFTPEEIFSLIGKLLAAKVGARTEALISGEVVTTVAISESIDIAEPDGFADYLPQDDV